MLGLNKPVDEPGAAWPGITVGLFASFAGILYGYDTATISGLQEMDYWQETMGYPSTDRVALIVSILSVGTFVGALSAGYVSDKLGRKYGIIVSAMIPFNLGVALQTAATEQIMFIMGMFLQSLVVFWNRVKLKALRSPFCWLRRRSYLCSDSHVPIRNPAQMDQRHRGRVLSTLHHYRLVPSRYCFIRHEESHRQWQLPHSARYSVRLGTDSVYRSGVPS